MSGGGSTDWHSAADRLALFMQRYAVPDDKVARHLGWPVEKLRAYLTPEARRLKAASDIADTAVDKLLMRYRVALAHQTLKSAATKPLMPLDGGSRRSTAPTQKAAEGDQIATGNRKRKRRAIVQPLDAADTKLKAATPKEEGKISDTGSTNDQLDVRKPRRLAKTELICPIRLDVDLDGVRFQDTFLINAALTTCSPEAIATQIAQDEKMGDKLKDAIAEAIRRQILTFTSCLSTEPKSGRLYPIYLDLIIDGFSLRDQFEWDISNDSAAAQAFASTLCSDLNMPKRFEPAIVFSIFEQVTAYRIALSGRKWIGNNPFHVKGTGLTLPTSGSGYIETMPPLDDVIRETNDAKVLGKTRRSASETRKIFGDMWRKCTEEEKEYYGQMTEVENEKRRRDHVMEMRDRAVAEWEEDESRRKGLLASTTLEASAEYFRGLLLENYMSERHEVDTNREEEAAETGEEDEDEEA
uniref:Uncharacterized protein n=1 Tax=Phytophthora ramorum TaxID=164328 RepID=H3GJP7_PHYRM